MDSDKIIDYNEEPIYYCKNCMSLNIIDGGFMDYCGTCGCTDILKGSIEEYDEIHKKRFGNKVFYKE